MFKKKVEIKVEEKVDVLSKEAHSTNEAVSSVQAEGEGLDAVDTKAEEVVNAGDEAAAAEARMAAAAETKTEESAAAEKQAEPEKKAEPDWKTLYAVTLADFDNYKKRAARDREETYRYAEADILKDVLPAVDNLQLALANAKEKGDDPFVKGVQLVYDGLIKALADHGAKPMADLVGKELDPNFHEAIATLPDEKIEEGKISNVAKVGWLLNDKLLRAAQVVVSAGKPA